MSRDVGLLTAIALLLLSAADASQLETQGLQALDRHEYQQAEQIFSQLTQNDSKDYSAFFNLALAEVGLKKDDLAIEHFKQALVLSPGLYQAELNLALVYIRDQRPADAIPLLADVTKQKPGQAKPHVYLGEALRAESKWPEAEAAFREALKCDPNAARAELGLGEALLHQSKLDEAGPHFESAAARDASLQPFLLEYAVALAENGRAQQAIPIFQKFPNDPGAREKVGQIYLAANEPDKAVPEFEAAVQLAPTTANRLALATAYLRSHEDAKAVPLLKQALAASPDDWEVQMTVGRIYRDQRQFNEAAGYFATAAKLKPQAAESWSELAGVLTLLSQYPQALDALDRIRALNAEKPGHIFLRAIILDKLHQPKLALASYQQFLKVSNGQYPDQEFQARGRLRLLEHEVNGK